MEKLKTSDLHAKQQVDMLEMLMFVQRKGNSEQFNGNGCSEYCVT